MSIKYVAFLLLVPFCTLNVARADIASSAYVDQQTNTKVDTRQEAEQTLSGKYIVTGTLEVPDAPLPPLN